ncbi:MAG: glycopeptidase, partial [Sulfolobus sp.]|nr:glycopeptidase [Sulfolobus sp.]
GGFSGIVEVINSSGGAELVSLTSNTALTTKNLKVWYLIDGKEFEELFSAQGQQYSVSNILGRYNYIYQNYIYII